MMSTHSGICLIGHGKTIVYTLFCLHDKEEGEGEEAVKICASSLLAKIRRYTHS